LAGAEQLTARLVARRSRLAFEADGGTRRLGEQRRESLLSFTPFAAAGAGRTLFTRAGDIDGDGAALKFFVVELGDGFLRFFGCGVFHESEAARFARVAIQDEVDGGHRPCLGEVVLEIVFSRLI
jgi:hypothetical protein